ncbi:MAG TPA: DUF4350 domain-containing protein [Chloroflexota bacterium]|nr:DUF4350 domain-containing protein [Chloroflexota bacterium]
MSRSRSGVLLAALAVALLVVTALVARPAPPSQPALAVRSSEPTGGRALALWLESLGYSVDEIDAEPYAVDPVVSGLFILAPETPFADDAVDAVAHWVEGGGQLVLVTEDGPRALLDRFGLRVRFAGDRLAEATVAQPLLRQPPVDRVRVDTWAALEGQEGLAPWLVAGDHVVLGSRAYGQGRVVVLTALRPLSNEGLADAESAALALNLVGGLPPGARVAFDEYHHGVVRGAARGLWQLLLANYWGWALIYAVALGYLYLWLRGRRFGPPLRDAVAARRSVSEYVASLGALYRRAGQRGYVADRLADQLKRELATGLGLNPRLPDGAFAQAVAERRATSAAPLADALARLRAGGRLAERDLLTLVRESDALKARLLRRPG